MDWYGIGTLLRAVTERAGIGAALLVIFALLLLGGLAWCGKHLLTLADRWLELQERERAALLAELSTTRAQVHEFLTNHLAHLQAHDNEMAKTMAGILVAQAETLDQMKRHREEQGDGLRRIDERHDAMSQQLSKIEGGMNI